MIGSFGAGISAGTAIGAAHTVTTAGSAANTSRRRRHSSSVTKEEKGNVQWECVRERRTSRDSGFPMGLVMGLMVLLLGAFAFLMLIFFVNKPSEIHAGTVSPEAIERARQRELANQPPPPTHLYSQKVPTKILYVGSYKHISARVRNQATGTVDSVYLCKKHCGLRYEGTEPGSVLDITWHSYRGQDGIFQRVDARELKRLYR